MKNLLFALGLCLTASAAAKETSASNTPAAVVLEDAQRSTLVELHDRFVESIEDGSRRAALVGISQTRPQTQADIKSLFDLFMRFPQPAVRDAVMSSVRLLTPNDAGLEPAFLEYLKLPESETRIFGINGAFRLRSLRALPLIQSIAQARFTYKSPGEAPILSDKNIWWTQYEALSSLAQWQGAQALPLLRRKAAEAPAVARLMAMYLWKESLPSIIKWAGSSGMEEECSHEALTADVPQSALRETRAELLRVLRDPRSGRELRHQLAIKVGTSSTPEEIDSLLAEEAASKDVQIKLAFSTALFASRSPKTIPWLKKLSAEDLNPQIRLGSLLQLRLLLSPTEVRPLLEAAAANDPDAETRQSASDMLKAPPPLP